MGDSFFKKENQKKKNKKKQDKVLKREDRKINNNKGKSLDEMIIYVDVNGNFTDIPPHLQIKEESFSKSEKLNKNSGLKENIDYTGVVKFLSDKGYGFITEDKTQENVFFHSAQLTEIVVKNDKVKFRKEDSLKGFRAISIKKVNNLNK